MQLFRGYGAPCGPRALIRPRTIPRFVCGGFMIAVRTDRYDWPWYGIRYGRPAGPLHGTTKNAALVGFVHVGALFMAF
jgi:hypothetical protein